MVTLLSRLGTITGMSLAGGVEVDCNPFPHCIMRNFIQDQTFVENLQRELLDLNFHDKSNDLYKFKQVGRALVLP